MQGVFKSSNKKKNLKRHSFKIGSRLCTGRDRWPDHSGSPSGAPSASSPSERRTCWERKLYEVWAAGERGKKIDQYFIIS